MGPSPPHPASDRRRRRLAAAVAAAALAATAAPPAEARLAVFVDGRILKVTDAVLAGDRIVLDLPGGGVLEVAATRIDRVVADEVEVTAPEPPDPWAHCDPGWDPTPLADDTPFADQIAAAAERAGIHPRLLAAVVRAESAFDPWAVSRAGASGLTQLMPAAAQDHGVVDVFDPAENLRGGAQHLRAMLDRFESLPLALAAYNAGAATVERYGGVPPFRETRHYLRSVLGSYCPAGG
jgi:hypothetical protein